MSLRMFWKYRNSEFRYRFIFAESILGTCLQFLCAYFACTSFFTTKIVVSTYELLNQIRVIQLLCMHVGTKFRITNTNLHYLSREFLQELSWLQETFALKFLLALLISLHIFKSNFQPNVSVFRFPDIVIHVIELQTTSIIINIGFEF